MHAKYTALVALVIAGFAQAVTVSCDLSSRLTTYRPTQPWPFDSVAVIGRWYPSCASTFECVEPPALIGAVAHVEGNNVTLDMYASDGAALPAGVPSHAVTEPQVAMVEAALTVSLAPGTYTLTTRAFIVNNGMSLACPGKQSETSIIIVPANGLVERLTAIEFYNATLDHYFITATQQEIRDLDNGVHTGWSRTGQTFGVYAPAKSGGSAASVCRYYGLPSAGIDSHFYAAEQYECDSMPVRFHDAWKLESANAFEARLPAGYYAQPNLCTPGFVPVWRMWNQRTDSNHRFVADIHVAVSMWDKGWLSEGIGWCAPE
jgi:hypothetical protein